MSSTHGDQASTNRIGSTPAQVSAEHHLGHSFDPILTMCIDL
jgi:uncharacterized protein GlcG (DUF336 family)